jgi:hypothetical protein
MVKIMNRILKRMQKVADSTNDVDEIASGIVDDFIGEYYDSLYKKVVNEAYHDLSSNTSIIDDLPNYDWQKPIDAVINGLIADNIDDYVKYTAGLDVDSAEGKAVKRKATELIRSHFTL